MDFKIKALKLVENGQYCFDITDYAANEFNDISAGLIASKDLGYIYKIAIERSFRRDTYGSPKKVLVSALTPLGKEWLKNQALTQTDQNTEKQIQNKFKTIKPMLRTIGKTLGVIAATIAVFGTLIGITVDWDNFTRIAAEWSKKLL